MSSAIREWLNLGMRWIHVFAGVMWVGQTYYFTWLDGQFEASGHCGRRRRHGGGMDHLRSGITLTLGKIANRVHGIWTGDDGGRGMGIDARVQRPCCVHPCGSDLRHDHDLERVDANSS